MAKIKQSASTADTIHRTNTRLGQTKMERMIIFNYIALPFKLAVGNIIRNQHPEQERDRKQALSWFSDGTCPTVAILRQGATGWKAMHGLYNWHQLPGTPVHAKVLEWAWLNSRQAQAIRNRYRMVVRELESALQEKLAEGHPVIKLYSLAGGSGQAVFEAASRFPHPERLQITLMDKDQTALKQSAKLAREDFKLTNELQLQEIDIIETPIESLKDHHGQAHIVEMVGLMDYLSANSCDQALSKALTLLNPEGHLVTAHIHPNEEKILLERILDWAPMIYKTKAQFKQLLEKQAAKLHSFHTEPHRIHSVSRLKKQA